MIAQFFTISGYAFWCIILAVIVLDVLLLSGDNEPPAIVLSLLLAIGVILFSDALVNVRVTTFIAGLAAYIAIGTAWSFFKWTRLIATKIKDLRTTFDPRQRVETFETYVAGKCPRAAEYKTVIIGWMSLWPLSVSWWVLELPRHAFIWLYEKLTSLYDDVAARIWKRLVNG